MRQVARAVAWLVLAMANVGVWVADRLYGFGKWLQLLGS